MIILASLRWHSSLSILAASITPEKMNNPISKIPDDVQDKISFGTDDVAESPSGCGPDSSQSEKLQQNKNH
jgi:hypothetical protein